MAAETTEQLWGGETTKAVDNFPVSGEPIPLPVARWLGRIKAAAARANAARDGRDGEFDETLDAFCDEWNLGSEDDARFELQYLVAVGTAG